MMRLPKAASGQSSSCGCDASARQSTVAARKATTATPPSPKPPPAAAMPEMDASEPLSDAAPIVDTKIMDRNKTDSKSMKDIKKNLSLAYKTGRDMTTCRTDYNARTAGVRTGPMWAVIHASHSNKDAKTQATFIPWANAPESFTPMESTSKTMFE
jgi:hypothetical protein